MRIHFVQGRMSSAAGGRSSFAITPWRWDLGGHRTMKPRPRRSTDQDIKTHVQPLAGLIRILRDHRKGDQPGALPGPQAKAHPKSGVHCGTRRAKR